MLEGVWNTVNLLNIVTDKLDADRFAIVRPAILVHQNGIFAHISLLKPIHIYVAILSFTPKFAIVSHIVIEIGDIVSTYVIVKFLFVVVQT